MTNPNPTYTVYRHQTSHDKSISNDKTGLTMIESCFSSKRARTLSNSQEDLVNSRSTVNHKSLRILYMNLIKLKTKMVLLNY